MPRLTNLLAFALFGGGVLVISPPLLMGVAAQEQTVRVLVSESTRSLRIRASGETPLLVSGLSARKKSVKALTVKIQNGRIKVLLDEQMGKWQSLPSDSKILIEGRGSKGIWLGKRRYRGKLLVLKNSSGLRAINSLGIESYLASVVGSEMLKSWPIEALKAQAVAARTYALNQIENENLYDIQSTESSQVYLGVESETPQTTKAVRKTRSLVLTHNGKLIEAVFHSSAGGLTESSGNVWKKNLPYLISVPDYDHHSPKYQWDILFTQKELQKIFYQLGEIRNIVLLNISPSGRVLNVRVEGTLGNVVLSGKELRARLGLKSTLVRFRMISLRDFRKSLLSDFSGPSFRANYDSQTPTDAMRNSLGFWRDWSKGGESKLLFRLPTLKPLPPLWKKFGLRTELDQELALFPLPPLPLPKNNPVLLARGFGAGHGVGMSQWGAHGLAQSGAGFRQILSHYYTDVAIRNYSVL